MIKDSLFLSWLSDFKLISTFQTAPTPQKNGKIEKRLRVI